MVGTVFQIGLAPNRIDVIASIDGVDFDAAWGCPVGVSPLLPTKAGPDLRSWATDDMIMSPRRTHTLPGPRDQCSRAAYGPARRGPDSASPPKGVQPSEPPDPRRCTP